jgi:hypothetical protein
MKNRRSWWGAVAGVVAALALTGGCTTYELGSTLPPGIESIDIPAVVNRTDEPLLETEVTRELRREFQRDGTLRLAAAGSADARVDVTLVKFKLEPLRYEHDESRSVQEYRMYITADVVVTRRGETKPMMQREMQGDTTFQFFGDLASSKVQGTPLAARDLAHDIVEALVEYW